MLFDDHEEDQKWIYVERKVWPCDGVAYYSISDWKRVIAYMVNDNKPVAMRHAGQLVTISGAVGIKEGPNPHPITKGSYHSHPGDGGEGSPGSRERYRKLLEEAE